MKLNLTRRHVGAGIASVSLAAGVVAGTGMTLAANGADPASFSAIVLGVGQDETSRTVAWYSSENPSGGEAVELATKADFSDKRLVGAKVAANITTDNATGETLTNFNGKVTLTGLKADTTYYYRVAEKGSSNHSDSYSFKTGAFGNGDFQFLFFGDPQIGSSGDPEADGEGWEFAMAQTERQSPKAELYVSGGDQVNTANNETEWANFLQPDQLRSIPWAATIGNHDNGGIAYDQHFALPDTKRNDPNLYSSNSNEVTPTSKPGGDYWFTYKGVLFIDLNSNAYSAANGSDPAHVQFVTDTIRDHGAGTKHTVLVYHHSIYSAASHANDGDNYLRRRDFTKAFSDLGVDLVLQGHDHVYSRSYALKGTELGQDAVKANPNEQPGQATVVAEEGGVVYVTANSASGSKYYDLTEPDTAANEGDGVADNGYGPDDKIGGPQSVQDGDPSQAHVRHWANSVESQEHLQQYVEVTVNDQGLQVKNIRANDGSGPNPAIDRGNVSGIGPELSDWAPPIGSVQDQVSIFRDKADVSPILPPGTTTTNTTIHTVKVPGPTVTKTVTVTKEVTPARLKITVANKLKALTKQIKRAEGDKKARLKARRTAFRAIQKQLR
jgi:hypothetical protein